MNPNQAIQPVACRYTYRATLTPIHIYLLLILKLKQNYIISAVMNAQVKQLHCVTKLKKNNNSELKVKHCGFCHECYMYLPHTATHEKEPVNPELPTVFSCQRLPVYV
jgi:hypothetical protein